MNPIKEIDKKLNGINWSYLKGAIDMLVLLFAIVGVITVVAHSTNILRELTTISPVAGDKFEVLSLKK